MIVVRHQQAIGVAKQPAQPGLVVEAIQRLKPLGRVAIEAVEGAAQSLIDLPQRGGIMLAVNTVNAPFGLRGVGQRQGYTRDMPMVRHLLQQIGHHRRQPRMAAMTQLLTHVGGEQVGEFPAARLLLTH